MGSRLNSDESTSTLFFPRNLALSVTRTASCFASDPMAALRSAGYLTFVSDCAPT